MLRTRSTHPMVSASGHVTQRHPYAARHVEHFLNLAAISSLLASFGRKGLSRLLLQPGIVFVQNVATLG